MKNIIKLIFCSVIIFAVCISSLVVNLKPKESKVNSVLEFADLITVAQAFSLQSNEDLDNLDKLGMLNKYQNLSFDLSFAITGTETMEMVCTVKTSKNAIWIGATMVAPSYSTLGEHLECEFFCERGKPVLVKMTTDIEELQHVYDGKWIRSSAIDFLSLESKKSIKMKLRFYRLF